MTITREDGYAPLVREIVSWQPVVVPHGVNARDAVTCVAVSVFAAVIRIVPPLTLWIVYASV